MPAPKNEKIRKDILKVLGRAKHTMSRADIAAKLGVDPSTLPLLEMQRERVVKRHGETRMSTYSAT